MLTVLLFINLSLWQFDRLSEKKEQNRLVETISNNEPAALDSLEGVNALEEFSPIEDSVTIVNNDLIRVVNRSLNGQAGEHVVALAKTDSGFHVLLNRGFVALNTDLTEDFALDKKILIEGWIRNSVEKDTFGVQDSLSPEQAPRFDVDAISKRLDPEIELAQVWVQLKENETISKNSIPTPVDLPERTEGSHLSYAMQWLIFSLLTLIFYYFILKRKSSIQIQV